MKIWQILKKENIGKIYISNSKPSIKIIIREIECDNKKEITAMTITESGEQQTYFSINTSSLNIEFTECNKRKENREIPIIMLRRRQIKPKIEKEFIITYIIDYGFCGGYDVDIETKVEVYRDDNEAYRRYYSLLRNSNVYDIRLERRC